jgi:hypothetical protein
MRDVRRLVEAGAAVAVASKVRGWLDNPIVEVTLFPNRASALKRYPAWTIMPRRAAR